MSRENNIFSSGRQETQRVQGEKYDPIKELAQELGDEVIGQELACNAVAGAVILSKAGLNDPDRAQGILMFLGPTGVGKTELAKALAQNEYGSNWKDRFIRIDCTSLQEKTAIARLKGSDPGYTGYGDPPLITPDKIKNGAIVVFDEIEKADSSVWKWLMSAMEEGETVIYCETEDSKQSTGTKRAEPQTLDFRKTFLIFTSNEGVEQIQQARDQGEIEDLQEVGLQALRTGNFRTLPEFLGRIDDTIVFDELKPEHCRIILQRFIAKINEAQARKNQSNHIVISAGDAMIEYILSRSDTSHHGARKIRQVLQKLLVQKVASEIVSERISRTGINHVYVDMQDGEVVISCKSEEDVMEERKREQELIEQQKKEQERREAILGIVHKLVDVIKESDRKNKYRGLSYLCVSLVKSDPSFAEDIMIYLRDEGQYSELAYILKFGDVKGSSLYEKIMEEIKDRDSDIVAASQINRSGMMFLTLELGSANAYFAKRTIEINIGKNDFSIENILLAIMLANADRKFAKEYLDAHGDKFYRKWFSIACTPEDEYLVDEGIADLKAKSEEYIFGSATWLGKALLNSMRL